MFEYKNKKLIPESDFTKDYKVFINEFNQTSNLMKDQAYQYFNDTKNIQA